MSYLKDWMRRPLDMGGWREVGRAFTRPNPHQQYSAEKAAWLHSHPHATPAEIERAMQLIAKRLGL